MYAISLGDDGAELPAPGGSTVSGRTASWSARSSSAEPSIAVARRLGMTKGGVLRESHLCQGKRHDEEDWSVLAVEWRAGKQAS